MRTAARIRYLALGVLTLGALTVPLGPASAVPSCGSTITVSTTLSADIGPCPAGGLIVGADGITLDLGGHRVFGTAATGDGVGILLPGRSNVTVRNGTVTGFDAGVALEGGGGNTVQSIAATDNIGPGTGSYGDGITLIASSNNRITGNRLVNNGPLSGVSLVSPVGVGSSSFNVIQGNDILRNVIGRDGTTANTDNDGVRIENRSNSNTISGNRVSDNGLDGIAIFADTADNKVSGNTVTGNGMYRTTARHGYGIVVSNRSVRATIENNSVYGNADSGIEIRPDSTSNVIRANQSVRNAVRPPLATMFFPSADLKDANPGCNGNTWFGNRYGTAIPACTTTGGQQV